MAELLARLGRQPGAGRLRRATLEAGVDRALGSWLAERVRSCRREGDGLELEIEGSAAAAQVRELSDEVLRRLREELGPDAPTRLRVRGCQAARPAGRAKGGAPARDVEAPPPGPSTAEALAGVEEPELRAQLARVAARGTRRSELEGPLRGG